MSYAKYFYENKNDNEDISIPPNKNIKQEYNNHLLPPKIKSNIGISTILNYQNKSSNINKINKNENLNSSNINISSSLKDQILSPGDDDISSNFNTGKIPQSKFSNYLDDDIIFNQLNYHYLPRNINPFSLISKLEKENEDYNKLNIYSKTKNKNNKKTLILDLDETLVHSSFKPINYNNVFHKPDIFLSIDFRGNTHSVYVLKRPYVHEFLKEMSKIYNIIIFTASVQEYANPLLDKLDTENVIKKRLFREDCCKGITGKFIKDLKILNMNLKDLILVDNNPISYSYNICNGVPIKTWHYDKTDQELIKLIPVLQFLANVNDVRDYIPKFVENDEIDFRKINLMINEINDENEQNKSLRPRAKSQKKFLGNYKEKKNHSMNYLYNKKINNNNIDINNIPNISNIQNKNKKMKIYEESKTNLKSYNNKNKNYYENFNNNNNNNNIKIIKNKNLDINKEYNLHEKIIDYRNSNNNFEYKNNSISNYNYNNYISKNENTNLIKKEKSDIIKKERHRNESTKPYINGNNNNNANNNNDKIQSIQSYYKKNYFDENIYFLNNNYLNNDYKNQRNKSNNYNNNVVNERKYIQLNGNNGNKYNYKENQNNLYENIKINNVNIQYLNENRNKYANEQKKENQKNNYLFSYDTKINNGFITPQINNKYTSNYNINPISTKNNNSILNKENNNNHDNNHLSFNYNQDNNKILENKKIDKNMDSYLHNNNNNTNNNKNILNNEIIKNNSSNFNRYYKDLNKNDFIYKYSSLKKVINNFEILNSQIQLNKEYSNKMEINNDLDNIYNKTATNFYQSKINKDNLYNKDLNSNSNLNIYSNNLYNKEESKINNIINQEKKDNKNEYMYKKHNSPYKISKETNYYIKRRMKLNKEKNNNKKKQNDELYVSFNQKNEKDNYLDNINGNKQNNYFYNIQQKYFRNERENYFYVNKKY